MAVNKKTNKSKTPNSKKPKPEKTCASQSAKRKYGREKKTPRIDNQINGGLFSNCEQGKHNDFYISFHSPTTFSYEIRTEGYVIPEWVPISFRPPSDMGLDEVEADVASYIFMPDDENQHGDEIMIKATSGIRDRKTLKTLMPEGWVDQEVLNLLVCGLTHNERSVPDCLIAWFLPTTFAQYALDCGGKAKNAISSFQHDYMGKISCVKKIFVPINDANVHWYLMVVDLHERKVLLLDSLPCDERRQYRRIQVKRMALFLEEMLMDRSFYDQPIYHHQHFISDFSLIEPRGIGRQQIGSNDCGVWVAQWMERCALTDDYDQVFVNRATRMHIALDLILSYNNELKDEAVTKAIKYGLDLEKERKAPVKNYFL